MTAEMILIETKTGKHPFFKQTGTPGGLMVILPGRGYLIEHPLLHYLRKMAVELGYDVLSVRYSFQMVADGGDNTINYDLLSGEIDLAVNRVVSQRQYNTVCMVGKSLGTLVAVRQGERFKAVDLRYILLTPVGDATEQVGEHQTLAMVGTADAAYDAERVSLDEHKPTMHWHVLDGLNHSLEFEYGWDASVAVLGRVIAQCEEFLRMKP